MSEHDGIIKPKEESPATSDSTSASSDEFSSVGPERGWYRRGNVFIKRSIRPSEYMTNYRGEPHVPALGKERLQNEAEAMSFIRRNTDIPVPTLYGAFEVDGSYFVIMEYIEGVEMKSLTDDQRKVVEVELHQHLATLRKLKSNTIGGPSGIVIPPYRVMRHTKHDLLPARQSERDEFVFCHNDLSQPNIIVDPDTLKINAIIDWEYAGFWPEYFEGTFWRRYGPSVAIPLLKEKDDTLKLLQFLGLEELYVEERESVPET